MAQGCWPLALGFWRTREPPTSKPKAKPTAIYRRGREGRRGPPLLHRGAGAFEDFGHGSVADSVYDKAFLIEAIFTKEQFGEAVAIDVNGVNQLQARGDIQPGRISHALRQFLGVAVDIHPRNYSDIARYEFFRSALRCGSAASLGAGGEITARHFGSDYHHSIVAQVEIE